MNIAELLNLPAAIVPDREILSFEGEASDYATLQDAAGRTASAMASLGLRRGDRVGVLQTNTSSVVIALYAAAALGAVSVPLNFRARESELRHMITAAGPRLLLVGNRYRDLAEQATSDMPKESRPLLVAIEDPLEGVPHLPTLADGLECLPAAEIDPGDLAVLMFTSGTTANPKAAMLGHEQLTSFILNTTDPASSGDDETTLLAAPLYHIAGLGALLTAVFAGRRVVLMRQFEAGQWLRTVERQRVTHAFLVPTMLKQALEHEQFRTADLSSLRVLSYGAAPAPRSLIMAAIRSMPEHVAFINSYGQTETTSTVSVLGPEDHRLDGSPEEVANRIRRLGSIGRPLPDVEICVMDESGRPVPAGTVGEVAIRSDRIASGYYGEVASQPALRDGWLLTSDLGWMDEDGYVFLSGRASDLIIRGGENIAPEEIEAVLASSEAVDDVAVVGVPDELWGERVHAVVVRKPGADISAEGLMRICGQLASFKRPDAITFARELPRNAMGKVLRKDVRAELAAVMAGEKAMATEGADQ